MTSNKRMASFDLPLSTANTIYNLSITVLIGGIILVLLSTASLIWSGLIKEKYATEKIAHDHAAAVAAKAAVEKAKSDAEAAQQQMLVAQAAAARLEEQKLNPHTLDREISLKKSAQFKEFVQNFSKGKVFVGTSSTEPESINYAKQIADMLTAAGYQVTQRTDLLLPPEQEFTGVHVRIKSMAAQPTYAGSLQKGLEHVDIDTAGELDDNAEDGVLILVGTKPD